MTTLNRNANSKLIVKKTPKLNFDAKKVISVFLLFTIAAIICRKEIALWFAPKQLQHINISDVVSVGYLRNDKLR